MGAVRDEERSIVLSQTIPGIGEQICTVETTRHGGVNREMETGNNGSEIETNQAFGEVERKY